MEESQQQRNRKKALEILATEKKKVDKEAQSAGLLRSKNHGRENDDPGDTAGKVSIKVEVSECTDMTKADEKKAVRNEL